MRERVPLKRSAKVKGSRCGSKVPGMLGMIRSILSLALSHTVCQERISAAQDKN